MGKKWIVPVAVVGGLGIAYLLSKRVEAKRTPPPPPSKLDVTVDLSSITPCYQKLFKIAPKYSFSGSLTFSNVSYPVDYSMLFIEFQNSGDPSGERVGLYVDPTNKKEIYACVPHGWFVCKKVADLKDINNRFDVSYGNGVFAVGCCGNKVSMEDGGFTVDTVAVGITCGSSGKKWVGEVRIDIS